MVLLYATGGVAFAGVDVTAETNYAGAVRVKDSESKTLTGFVVGGGIEPMLAENVSG